MEYLNEVRIEGRVASAPNLSKMPVGTPLLWFELQAQETFDDGATGLPRRRTSKFRVEILGKNVSLYADDIKQGRHVRVIGFLREDNGSVRIRVYRLTVLKTFYDGITQALTQALSALRTCSQEDAIKQLEVMRSACDPLNPDSPPSS